MRQLTRLVAVACMAVALAAPPLVALPKPAQAVHDYDGLVPTTNYDIICLSVGNDWRYAAP